MGIQDAQSRKIPDLVVSVSDSVSVSVCVGVGVGVGVSVGGIGCNAKNAYGLTGVGKGRFKIMLILCVPVFLLPMGKG